MFLLIVRSIRDHYCNVFDTCCWTSKVINCLHIDHLSTTTLGLVCFLTSSPLFGQICMIEMFTTDSYVHCSLNSIAKLMLKARSSYKTQEHPVQCWCPCWFVVAQRRRLRGGSAKQKWQLSGGNFKFVKYFIWFALLNTKYNK